MMAARTLAEAIGRVFDREHAEMRQRGYASLGPHVEIFSAFVKGTEMSVRLATEILVEAQMRDQQYERRPQPIRPSPMMGELGRGRPSLLRWLRERKRPIEDDDSWRDYDHGFRDGYQSALRERGAD